jgi:uncharacterized protein (DUF1810 family)
MTDPDLMRFLHAQDQTFARVIEELTNGRKQTHWMWFIFPQLAGLDKASWRSATPSGISIRRDGISRTRLGPRLRQVVSLMIDHKGKSAFEILGSPDDLKFRSCLTLFHEAADETVDRVLFGTALDQFYQGQPDSRTSELLF